MKDFPSLELNFAKIIKTLKTKTKVFIFIDVKDIGRFKIERPKRPRYFEGRWEWNNIKENDTISIKVEKYEVSGKIYGRMHLIKNYGQIEIEKLKEYHEEKIRRVEEEKTRLFNEMQRSLSHPK